MTQYRTNNWKEFRDSVIELDGHRCSACGKSNDEVVLQVHHKKYTKGLKPWEYAYRDCITLCRGCHAEEHGIIKPKVGWDFQGYEDLGDLIGTCENCGSTLRHVFYVFHENWGTIEVGTYCCDSLTDTNIASNCIESQKRYDEREKRFINSKRWKNERNVHVIKQNNLNIEIKQIDLEFFIKIHNLKGKKTYPTLKAAKSQVFYVIESGKLMDYCKKHNISLPVQKKEGKSNKAIDNFKIKRMNIAKGRFSLFCSNCEKQHDFNSDDSDFELINVDAENPMGPKRGFLWEHSFKCDSEKCNNEIEIEYEVYEYPIGTLETDEIKISGGKEKQRFDYDFS